MNKRVMKLTAGTGALLLGLFLVSCFNKPEDKGSNAASGNLAVDKVDTAQPPAAAPANSEEQMKAGAIVYKTNCIACHQENGQGIPNTFPPLANSDFLMADKARSIKVIKKGLEGSITVNGNTFNGQMPALGLSDGDIASVLTFVRNSFGNKGEAVTAEEVKASN